VPRKESRARARPCTLDGPLRGPQHTARAVCLDGVRSTQIDVPRERGEGENRRLSLAASAEPPGPSALGVRRSLYLSGRTTDRYHLGRANALAARLLVVGRANAPPHPSRRLQRHCSRFIARRGVPLIGLAPWQRALGTQVPFDPITIAAAAARGGWATQTRASGRPDQPCVIAKASARLARGRPERVERVPDRRASAPWATTVSDQGESWRSRHCAGQPAQDGE
jgi:hypothetical protein